MRAGAFSAASVPAGARNACERVRSSSPPSAKRPPIARRTRTARAYEAARRREIVGICTRSMLAPKDARVALRMCRNGHEFLATQTWVTQDQRVTNQLVGFLGVSLLVIVVPGPDTALTIRNALSGGRGAGVFTALGVATGQAVWTLATCTGLAALLLASEPA